ncbi:MAG: DUF2892 domain-containing protein [Ignavibacteria bacterium]|jgi:hypothetical protein|nr:DUF2892 domain-containing protein [Ignavibacteria bacterium]
MKSNMGKADKIIRLFFGIIIVGLYLEGQISGLGALLLVAVAALLFVTSFFSFCPLYFPFGISTGKKHSDTVR